MNELDERLRQLVIETCRHPRGSLERQKGLNQIVWQIQRSGRLLNGYGVPEREDALQKTWLYFSRNLCEATTCPCYDPQTASVITWLNAYLKRRFEDNRQKPPGHVEWDGDPPTPPEPQPILEKILEWVEQEVQLRRIHVRDRPDVNCQVLILRRLPPETPWEVLAQEFGVPISTLSGFYQRKCFPRLLDFGKEQGYL